ncbi:HNH endonuclease [Aquipuribacter hungaricus]|uniref:HNH endonuclease n=1 Tax=Aquipuribacter hungaricus TaxID=545624 RepID=A0ABV7WEP7_9MICO
MRSSPPGVDDLLRLVEALRLLDRSVDDATRVSRLRALEMLKAAASAAQARDTADLAASRHAQRAAAGVPPQERGRGVAAEVALARRDSPRRGAQHLGLATALVHEMPCTLAALEAGRISEWRATVLVRDTACLTRADRTAVDAEVAGDPAVLEQLGDRALGARVRQAAYRLDPLSVVERARRVERERRVTLRPAPDTMAYLTALLPVAAAVSVVAALGRAADAARGCGDGRPRGQVMADTLVASVVQHPEVPAPAGERGAAVRLVMTDRALLDGGDEPADVEGYGPVPAGWARELLAGTLDRGDEVWLRRLVLSPVSGRPVATDSHARLAPRALADWVRTRDAGTCRTPWCDAPARHVDHVVPHARGGPTTAENLQGLCEACNHAKEAPGWRASVVLDRAVVGRGGAAAVRGDPLSDEPPDDGLADDGPHTVVTRTPTGHRYRSVAPPLPGAQRGQDPRGQSGGPPGPDPLEVQDDGIAGVVERWLAGRLLTGALGLL